MNLAALEKELKTLENPDVADFLQGFFKIGEGEYGEGDLYRKIRVPVLRKSARKYRGLSIAENENFPVRRFTKTACSRFLAC